jgi:cellulose synthase/poly-beta-1,6-N-acetylglucosamine synthase-like glycosyltransferase
MRDGVPLTVAVGLGVLAAVWTGLNLDESLAWHFSLAVYLLVNFAASVDLLDFGIRAYLRQASGGSRTQRWSSPTSVGLDIGDYTAYQRTVHLRPYAFVVSVYNMHDQLDDFLEAMRPYRERFWIVDDGSSDRTCERLRQAGWRCIDGGRNRKKPGALRFLLTSLPPEIETVVVLDPDFTIRDSGRYELSDLETVIFDFQRSGMAALCPRIAIKRDGVLSRFQSLEYHMAFSLGRRSLGSHSINSGASIYRRSALEEALRHHTLSVYGEDFQTSVLLLAAGESVYYDGRLVLETEGKRLWRSWFSQRVGWSFGLLAVYMWHASRIWTVAKRGPIASYHFLLYTGVLVLLAHPLRVLAAVILALSTLNGLDLLLALDVVPDSWATDPGNVVALFVLQTLLALLALLIAVPREDRLYLAPIVPLYTMYALAQVLPVTVGYLNWLGVATVGRRVWGDHYQDDVSLRNEIARRRAALGALAARAGEPVDG